MILAEEDAALFYRAWGALLTWVNDQRRVIPPFPRPTPGHPIDPMLATKIRRREEATWELTSDPSTPPALDEEAHP